MSHIWAANLGQNLCFPNHKDTNVAKMAKTKRTSSAQNCVIFKGARPWLVFCDSNRKSQITGDLRQCELVYFSFARFDVDNVKKEGARLLRARAGRGPGRGTGEERARKGERNGVRGRGRKTLVFGGYESVSRAK